MLLQRRDMVRYLMKPRVQVVTGNQFSVSHVYLVTLQYTNVALLFRHPVHLNTYLLQKYFYHKNIKILVRSGQGVRTQGTLLYPIDLQKLVDLVYKADLPVPSCFLHKYPLHRMSQCAIFHERIQQILTRSLSM